MASSFPGSIDNFTDPLSNSALSSPSHAGQHSDLNDAVEKIETYMGLVKVIPTAATNGTITADGDVTIGNAVSSVSVTCFSALYDNYRILVSGGTSSASNVFALTFGSQATAYYWSFLYSVWGGTTATADTGNNTTRFLYVGQTNTRGNYADISVVSPFLTNDTYISASSPYGGGTYSGTVNGGLAVTTSFTSFTLTCNAGTVTGGTIRVYGYRN
jgi:hypothetical protein